MPPCARRSEGIRCWSRRRRVVVAHGCPSLVFLFAGFGLHLLGLNLSVRLGSAHQIAPRGLRAGRPDAGRRPGDHALALPAAGGPGDRARRRGAGHRPVPRRLRGVGAGRRRGVRPVRRQHRGQRHSAGPTSGRSICSGSASTSSWRWSPGCSVRSSDLRPSPAIRPLLLLGASWRASGPSPPPWPCWPDSTGWSTGSRPGPSGRDSSARWYAFLDALPDLRLPFDLTLPEAVAAAGRWLTRDPHPRPSGRRSCFPWSGWR